MNAAYLVIYLSLLIFGVSVILALSWAIRSGQFQNLQRGAISIFDADEPLGMMTDAFPKTKE